MVLRVAAGGHVEQDAGLALLRSTGMGELQAELRLADARRAEDDRHRARQQPAAEEFVETSDAGGETR